MDKTNGDCREGSRYTGSAGILSGTGIGMQIGTGSIMGADWAMFTLMLGIGVC